MTDGKERQMDDLDAQLKKMRGELKRLQDERACEQDVLQCTLASAHDLGTNSRGVPRAVLIVKQILASRGATTEPGASRPSCAALHERTCRAMLAAATGGSDAAGDEGAGGQQPFRALAWVGVAWHLYADVVASLEGEPALSGFVARWDAVTRRRAGGEESGGSENESDGGAAGAGRIGDRYADTLCLVFREAVAQGRRAVDAVVVPSMTRGATEDRKTGPETVLTGMFEGVRALAREVCETMERAGVPAVLQCQYVQQLVWHACASTVNHTVATAGVCTSEYGVALALGLSALEEWAHASPFRAQLAPLLAPCKELANMLAIGKCILAEPQAAQDTFPALRTAQFLQVVRNISGDAFDETLEKAWEHALAEDKRPEQHEATLDTTQWVFYNAAD